MGAAVRDAARCLTVAASSAQDLRKDFVDLYHSHLHDCLIKPYDTTGDMRTPPVTATGAKPKGEGEEALPAPRRPVVVLF